MKWIIIKIEKYIILEEINSSLEQWKSVDNYENKETKNTKNKEKNSIAIHNRLGEYLSKKDIN